MCNRNYDYLVRLNRVDQAERKPPQQSAAKAMCNSDTKIGSLPYDVEGALYVIEKESTKARPRRLKKERCFGHFFLGRRKKPIADHRNRSRARAMTSSPGREGISPRR